MGLQVTVKQTYVYYRLLFLIADLRESRISFWNLDIKLHHEINKHVTSILC